MFRIDCFKAHGENYEKRIFVADDYKKYINENNEVFLTILYGNGDKQTIAEKCFDRIFIIKHYGENETTMVESLGTLEKRWKEVK